MKKRIALPSVVVPRVFQQLLTASELDYVGEVCQALYPSRGRHVSAAVRQTNDAVEKLFNAGALLTNNEKKLLQTLSMGLRLLGNKSVVQSRALEKLHHRMSEYRMIDEGSFVDSDGKVAELEVIVGNLKVHGVLSDSGKVQMLFDSYSVAEFQTFLKNECQLNLNQKKSRYVLRKLNNINNGISIPPLLDLELFQSFERYLESKKAVLRPKWSTIQSWKKKEVVEAKRPDDYIQVGQVNVPYYMLVREQELKEGKQDAGSRNLSTTRSLDMTVDAATGTAIPNRSTNIEHIQPFQQLMSRIGEMLDTVNSNAVIRNRFQRKFQRSGLFKAKNQKLVMTLFTLKMLHSWDINTVLMDGYLNILKGTLDPILYFQRNDFYGSSFVGYLSSDREVLSKGSDGLRELFDRSGVLYRLKTDERVNPKHRVKLLGKVVIQWMAENRKNLVRQKKRLDRLQKDNLLENIANRFIHDGRTSVAQKEKLRKLSTDMRRTKRHSHERRDDVREGVREVESAIGSTPVKHPVMTSTPGAKGKKRSGSGSSSDGRVSISSDDSQTVELRQKLVERDAEIVRLESELLAAHSQIEEQVKRHDLQLESQRKRHDEKMLEQAKRYELRLAEQERIHEEEIEALTKAFQEQLQSQGNTSEE